MGCFSRYGLMIFSIIFSVGMIISTVTPSWIETVVPIDANTAQIIEFGPFYSRSKDCPITNGEVQEDGCTEWADNEIDNDDCNSFSDNEETQEKLCRQHNTWRVLAMFCMFIVVGTAILVAIATCTQCFTCGCCGGSFDAIACVAYWIEVGLSIVCWSFCISVVMIVKDEDFTSLIAREAENFANISQIQDIQNGAFLWGFWVFIASGTVVGAICAIVAGWAAEGSILVMFKDCIACTFCCKKK